MAISTSQMQSVCNFAVPEADILVVSWILRGEEIELGKNWLLASRQGLSVSRRILVFYPCCDSGLPYGDSELRCGEK